jgi:hypothetical protein
VENVRNALLTLHDAQVRNTMGRNAKQFGEVAMNWRKGDEILHQEYSALLRAGLKQPASGRPDLRLTQAAQAPSEVEVR